MQPVPLAERCYYFRRMSERGAWVFIASYERYSARLAALEDWYSGDGGAPYQLQMVHYTQAEAQGEVARASARVMAGPDLFLLTRAGRVEARLYKPDALDALVLESYAGATRCTRVLPPALSHAELKRTIACELGLRSLGVIAHCAYAPVMSVIVCD